MSHESQISISGLNLGAVVKLKRGNGSFDDAYYWIITKWSSTYGTRSLLNLSNFEIYQSRALLQSAGSGAEFLLADRKGTMTPVNTPISDTLYFGYDNSLVKGSLVKPFTNTSVSNGTLQGWRQSGFGTYLVANEYRRGKVFVDINHFGKRNYDDFSFGSKFKIFSGELTVNTSI